MKFPLMTASQKRRWVMYIVVPLIFLLVFSKEALSPFQYQWLLCTVCMMYFFTLLIQWTKKPTIEGEVIFSATGLVFDKREETIIGYHAIRLSSYDAQFTFLKRSFSKGGDNYIQLSPSSGKIYFYIEDDLQYRALSRFLKEKNLSHSFKLKIS